MAETLAIFVEGPVVHKVTKEIGFIDFEKLGDHLAERLGCGDWRMRYFHCERSQGDIDPVVRFLDALSHIDRIDVQRVPARPLRLRCPEGHEFVYDDLTLHPHMINDMLVGAERDAFHVGVVVSGRSEFVPVLRHLDSLSDLRMATAFWSESRMLNDDLRDSVDFINLEEVDLARSRRSSRSNWSNPW